MLFISTQISAQTLVWGRDTGGTSIDEENETITVDGSGNAYVAGYFSGTVDFDPSASTYNLTSAGGDDIFIQKLDGNGALVWAKRIGGSADDYANDIILDPTGANVYVTGLFRNTVDFDPNAGVVNGTSAGVGDVFLLKLTSLGNYSWVKRMGGTMHDTGKSIGIDVSGNVYTTGYFESTSGSFSGISLSTAGGADIFVTKHTSSGTIVWAKRMGGTGYEEGKDIVIDASGDVLITGWFASSNADFDPGTASYTMASAGLDDIFVVELTTSGVFSWARKVGSTNYDRGYGIEVDNVGNVYVTGDFRGSVDFNPSSLSTYTLNTGGDNTDIYVLKLNTLGDFVAAIKIGTSSTGSGAYDIAIDASNNIYLTGYFTGTIDFNPSTSVDSRSSGGGMDIFTSSLTSALAHRWVRTIGDTGDDTGNGVDVGVLGYIYTTGYFNGIIDLNPNAGTFWVAAGSGSDAFIQKLGSPYYMHFSNGSHFKQSYLQCRWFGEC